jgi:hypothetical protein
MLLGIDGETVRVEFERLDLKDLLAKLDQSNTNGTFGL